MAAGAEMHGNLEELQFLLARSHGFLGFPFSLVSGPLRVPMESMPSASRKIRCSMQFLALLLLASLPALCQSASDLQSMTLADWPQLIADKKCAEARTLCTSYVYSSTISGRVGAQKCLANVELCEGNNLQQALMHLDVGLRIAPLDLSVHLERLRVLERTGDYALMPQMMEDSCNTYKGSDALDAWMSIAEELMDRRQYQAGLDVTLVIDKHYPNQAQVLNYLGMFSSALGKNDQAIAYMKRAASLSPHDGDIAWETARVYDAANQVELANRWYKKALPMSRSPHSLMENSCTYAQFLEAKMHDRSRACQMERQSCEVEQQTACAPQPVSQKK